MATKGFKKCLGFSSNSRIHKILTSAALLSLLSGCSLTNKTPDPMTDEQLRAQLSIEQQFEAASTMIDESRFAEAAQAIEGLLRKYPGSRMELPALYNLGVAYEGASQCEKALQAYRKVVRTAQGRFQAVEAKGYLRMSYAYECLGDDTRLIASLLDARKRASELPEEVSLTEIPARLALAYSRKGQKKPAETFLKKAEEGIKQLQRSPRGEKEKRELLSRALLQMGTVTEKQNGKYLDLGYVDSLKVLHPYLLKSVEVNGNKWSQVAADQILDSYERSFTLVQSLKPAAEIDPEISDRQLKIRKVEVAQHLLANISDLRSYRLPLETEPPLMKKVFESLDKMEARLRTFASTNIPLTPLTSEAKKSKSLSREGRVVSKETVLEKEASGRKGKKSQKEED